MGLVDRFRRANDAGSGQAANSTPRNRTTSDLGTRAPRLQNLRTGLGTANDAGLGSQFVPIRMTREEAERLYQMSWAAQKIVDIKVRDMFSKGRKFLGEDESAIDAMEEAEHNLKAMRRLANAMIAGRIWGTALMIVCTKDGRFDEPLEPEDIGEGDIANLWVVDRWACSVETWVTDPTIPGYGEPYHYRISGRIFGSPSPDGAYSKPTTSANVVVHRDRVFRFDGSVSPLTEGWTTGPWEREWGVSILTKAIDDIYRDADIHAGVGHLVNQASIWVMKVQDFKESIRGRTRSDMPTIEEQAEAISQNMSIYRMFTVDAEDEAERVNVTFAGLPDILNYQAQRLAAIEDIPVTRFMGTSASGLSATGEGDARDWRIAVAGYQKEILDPVMRRFDAMIARHAGLAEPLDYEWIPLGELTEMEAAEVAERRLNPLSKAFELGVINEEEWRERASQDEWIGEFEVWTPSEMTEMEMETAESERADRVAEVQARFANGGASGNGTKKAGSGNGSGAKSGSASASARKPPSR